MKFFLFFFLSSSFCLAQELELLERNEEKQIEEILVFQTKREQKKFGRAFSKFIKGAAASIHESILGGRIDVFSVENLATGLILHSGVLRPSAIHHDVDKVYSLFSAHLPPIKERKQERQEQQHALRHWGKTRIGTKITIPLRFDFAQDSSFIFSSRTEASRQGYRELITPLGEYLYQEDKLVDALLSKAQIGFRGVKKTKISNDPLKLWQSYPYGSEVAKVREYVFLESLSAGVPYKGVNVGARVYAAYQFKGEGRLKILGDPQRKLMSLTIARRNRYAKGVQFESGLSYKIFKLGFIQGRLNIKLVSKSSEKARGDELVHEYVYDIDYPMAQEALKEALKGNMQKTQSMSVDRGGEENYQGVLTIRNISSHFQEKLRRTRLGPSINENYLKVMEGTKKRKKIFRTNLFDEKVIIDKRKTTTETDEYLNQRSTDSYEYQMRKHRTGFWRFWRKYSKIIKSSSVIEKSPTVKLNQGREIAENLLIKYQLDLKVRNSTKRLREKEYTPIQRILSLIQSLDSDPDASFAQLCESEELRVELKGEIEQKALDYVLELDDETLLEKLSLMIGESKDNKVVKKFEKRFLPHIRLLRKTRDKYEIAEGFKNIFKAYKSDILPYEFILFLNKVNDSQLKLTVPFHDILTSVYVLGDSCEIKWNIIDSL